MKKIFTIIFVLTLVIIASASQVSACSYVYQVPQETYDSNDVVFIGSIKSTTQSGGINGTRSVTFEVLKSYKGSLAQTITMTTGANSAMCGFDEGSLIKGDIWVIHAQNSQSFNSLPHNQKYTSLVRAQEALDPLSEDSGPTMCPLNYAPVCGQKDTGIRCVTTPCPSTEVKTYGNSCQLAADKAEFLYEGECKQSPTKPVVTPSPKPIIDTNFDIDYQSTSTDTDVIYDANNTNQNLSFWQKIKNLFRWLFWFS